MVASTPPCRSAARPCQFDIFGGLSVFLILIHMGSDLVTIAEDLPDNVRWRASRLVAIERPCGSDGRQSWSEGDGDGLCKVFQAETVGSGRDSGRSQATLTILQFRLLIVHSGYLVITARHSIDHAAGQAVLDTTMSVSPLAMSRIPDRHSALKSGWFRGSEKRSNQANARHVPSERHR